jgi:hypothetical protein
LIGLAGCLPVYKIAMLVGIPAFIYHFSD